MENNNTNHVEVKTSNERAVMLASHILNKMVSITHTINEELIDNGDGTATIRAEIIKDINLTMSACEHVLKISDLEHPLARLNEKNILSLFHAKLEMPKLTMGKSNDDIKMLRVMWQAIPDNKKAALIYDDDFRKLLEYWEISFEEDMERLGVKLDGEDDIEVKTHLDRVVDMESTEDPAPQDGGYR